MLSTLRNRLILSHILPVLIVIPLAGIALFYLIETQFLLPNLADDITADARYLAEVSRADFELFGNPIFVANLLDRVRLDPAIQVMFLDPQGELLYSSDLADASKFDRQEELDGLDQALDGEEVVQTNYSITRLSDSLIDVITPVLDDNDQVIGLVRVSYQSAALFELLSQLRGLIIWVLVLGLVLGALLGLGLALNLSRPIQRVTHAMYDLAQGKTSEPLRIQGPQEIRELATAVNFLVDRLRNLESARRQLLANLVHELGRPLGALRSAIQAISKGAGEDPQLLSDLTIGMDGEAARMQNILEELAHLHDQVLGSLELHYEPIELAGWLLHTLLPWRQAAQEKHLTWEESIPSDLPTISADPDRLAQVIGNLASNAVRYTSAGGQVSISAGAKDGEVWVKVSDTGPGISLEDQARIFLPFYRGDQGRRIKQGMGLGLSIANDLAKAHGGRIELESAPGAGSQFTLLLPGA
jgi:signal transduction histidine kinase